MFDVHPFSVHPFSVQHFHSLKRVKLHSFRQDLQDHQDLLDIILLYPVHPVDPVRKKIDRSTLSLDPEALEGRLYTGRIP